MASVADIQGESGRSGGGQVVWLQRRAPAPGFTARDRSELERWSVSGRRSVIWDVDPAPFAMLYDGACPWASWAMSRQDGELLVWDCVSLEDVGRFGSVVEALASVGADFGLQEKRCNVIAFPLERLRRAERCGGARSA